jgi:hypothetical protein
LVAFVKRGCPTCVLVHPVLAQLAQQTTLTVLTQDDRTFPEGLSPVDDTSLEISWHHQVETVPTLLRVADGTEQARVVGWDRQEWEALSGVTGLGPELPNFRPGCGSLSVDPDRRADLAVRFQAIGCTPRSAGRARG